MKVETVSDRAGIHVQVATGGARVPVASDIENWARAAAGDADAEVTVRVAGEIEMAELNERYRHGQGATNVLAFAFEMPGNDWPGDAAPVNLLGDVVVCQEVVEREAREQGKALDAHFAHMVVHGVLHLRGYDHDHEAGAAVMEKEERRVLAVLGYGDPYAPECPVGELRQGAVP
ncbi:MAG: rRNA maturation RNase YbeY [Gammaproteobacteria bacterium]